MHYYRLQYKDRFTEVNDYINLTAYFKHSAENEFQIFTFGNNLLEAYIFIILSFIL
jgi:hypothetical protein